MIVLDYRDSRPLYQQVKDSLRRMMLTGLLEPDEKLPSVRSLATQLAINPNTIQRAYAELEAEGYIYSVAGKGSFVSAGDGEHARRIAELTQQLRPLVEELKSLGCTREKLMALRRGVRAGGPQRRGQVHHHPPSGGHLPAGQRRRAGGRPAGV